MENHIYQHSGAYPIPQDLQPNLRHGKILLDSYSGPTSELTAITQYIYHHLEAGDNHDISSCLRGIAIVEMHHLDMLGSCIRQLGLRPKFHSFQRRTPRCWSTGNIHYGCTLRDMVALDIQGEYNAIQNYYRAIKCIDDTQIQALLHRIIQDEELHIHHLEKLLQAL